MTPHTTAIASGTALTVQELLANIEAAVADLPRDPLSQKMAEDGFDPSTGGVLFLPETEEYRALLSGPFGPPSYIIFSPYVSMPTYGIWPLFITRVDFEAVKP